MPATPPECQRHRAVLSAHLDGVADGDGWARTRDHLASCHDCRSYRRDLVRLTGLVARSPAPDGTDLVPVVLARSGAGRWDPRATPWRALLAATALTQVLLGIPAVVPSAGTGPHLHDSRHLGAWSVAFGVGLLVAAGRPRHARSLLPVAATLAAMVVATALADLAAGNRSLLVEAVHVVEVAGVALLGRVAREAGAPPAVTAPGSGPVPAPGW